MERIVLKDLFVNSDKYADQQITVCGWARTIRDSKVFGFIELNDGSCFKSVQIVFEQDKIDNFDEIAKLNVGSALVVTGVFLRPKTSNHLKLRLPRLKWKVDPPQTTHCKKSVTL